MTGSEPRDPGTAEKQASTEDEPKARPTADREGVLVSKVERDRTAEDALEGEGHDSSRKATGSTARRKRGERVRLPLIVGSLIALIVVAAVFAAVRPASDNPNPPGQAPAALRASAAARFPDPPPARDGTTFTTDGDLRSDNEPIWQIEPDASETRVRPIFGGDRTPGKSIRLPLRRQSGTSYDIARWATYDAESLFTIRQRPRAVDVRVYDLLAGGGQIGGGKAPTASPQRPSTTRGFAVAHWGGNRSDLFVIDRGGRDERARVSVYSGESSFSERVAAFVLPVRGVDSKRWAVDVLRFDGARPDLAMVRRRGDSGRPELHVLKGERDFQEFTLQTPVGLPVGSGPRYKFLAGSTLGRPALYALDLDLTRLTSQPTLRVVPAGSPLGPAAN